MWEVFLCSLGAYGGPEAHFGVFFDRLAGKKAYVDKEELTELLALTSFLPGPSSTQVIVAIGYKLGGAWLGFWTFLVWAMPVILLMGAASFLGEAAGRFSLGEEQLRFLPPMAVGFMAVAAGNIAAKTIKGGLEAGIFAIAAALGFLWRHPLANPVLMLMGGVMALLIGGAGESRIQRRIRPPWVYLAVFAALALGSLAAPLFLDGGLAALFASFYRYGFMVIGGGQVVVPFMLGELVESRALIGYEEFLTGFGLVQGLPGPMFSFCAYAGGLAARGQGPIYQWAGAILGALGIFLPGILLIYFVYPIWEDVKGLSWIQGALSGIKPASGGLVAASAMHLMFKNGWAAESLAASALTAILLWRRVPPPLLVAASLAAGIFLGGPV